MCVILLITLLSKPPVNHKPKIVDTHIHKRKQSKHNTKYSNQITREQNKKGRKKTYKSKTINKNGNKNILIGNTLNVNRLNAQSKRHRQAEWIEKQTLHMLSTRDPFQI